MIIGLTLLAILAVVFAAFSWIGLRHRARAKTASALSIPDSWSISTGTYDGKQLFTRFNTALLSFEGRPLYPKQLGIAVPLNRQTTDGLPDPDESTELYELEEVIRSRLTASNESLLTGVITTSNMREFVLYTCDPPAALWKVQQLKKETTHHEIQFVFKDDPEWEIFKAFAVPQPANDPIDPTEHTAP